MLRPHFNVPTKLQRPANNPYVPDRDTQQIKLETEPWGCTTMVRALGPATGEPGALPLHMLV